MPIVFLDILPTMKACPLEDSYLLPEKWRPLSQGEGKIIAIPLEEVPDRNIQ